VGASVDAPRDSLLQEEASDAQAHLLARGGHPDRDGQASRAEQRPGGLDGLRLADRLDRGVDSEALDGADLRDDIRAAVHGVARTQLTGQFELGRIDVDGDDLLGARDAGPLDGREPDTAAADHGDGHSGLDAGGVERRTGSGEHATAEQADPLEGQVIGNRDAGSGAHHRLLGEGSHPAELVDRFAAGLQPGGAVDEGGVQHAGHHLHTEMRLPLQAEDALAALGGEGDHDAVSARQLVHPRAGLEHLARRLVSEHHGKGCAQRPVRVREVAAADSAGGDAQAHLPRMRSFQRHLLDRERSSDLAKYSRAHGILLIRM
jgi:hypothetical protein